MPKSKNKRKNGRAKGSDFRKKVAEHSKKEQAKKDAVVDMITQQMLR